MKLTLKPAAIICFWLYYFGSIKSANSKIFQISTKTIKFLFRRGYIKNHLNSKVFNSQVINFNLSLTYWHSFYYQLVLSVQTFSVCIDAKKKESFVKCSWPVLQLNLHDSIKSFFITFMKEIQWNNFSLTSQNKWKYRTADKIFQYEQKKCKTQSFRIRYNL